MADKNKPAIEEKLTWKPGKRDLLFLGIVAAVVLILVLGSSERKTKPVPDDAIHRTVSTKAACMTCHDSKGIHPQPKGHTKGGQCFQCHLQPKGWTGSR